MPAVRGTILKSVHVFGGKPVIAGTRISVDLVTSYFANGLGVNEIKRDYPHLTNSQIKAAIDYQGANMNRERAKLEPSVGKV